MNFLGGDNVEKDFSPTADGWMLSGSAPTEIVFLWKVRIELPYDPELPLVGIFPKGYKNINSKKHSLIIIHGSP